MATQIASRNRMKSNPENKVGTKIETLLRKFRRMFLRVRRLEMGNSCLDNFFDPTIVGIAALTLADQPTGSEIARSKQLAFDWELKVSFISLY
ncbi:MAG: hypothetical protein ABSA49_04080 [Rhizomicrobium sp.]|jgi:hypothetical protein